MSVYRIVHLSDVHIPPLPALDRSDFFTKRLLGLFSWHRKWKSEHRPEIIRALQRSLETIRPDHICITGDLTFTTHRFEVAQAVDWLESLGPADSISLVPGNHDAYVPGALDLACTQWARWMTDDASAEQRFPYLHRRGPVDIIGLSSGIPLRLPRTVGSLGTEQIEALKTVLTSIAGDDRPSILMIHHPVQEGAARRGKELLDRAALRQALDGQPVDLILHGHLHRPVRATLQGSRGPTDILGAGSASALGRRYAPAHFHLLEFDANDRRTMSLRHGHYDVGRDAFEVGKEEMLTRFVEPEQ